MKIKKFMSLILSVTLILSAGGIFSLAKYSESASNTDEIQDKIASMTLKEKIGQLFFIRPENLSENNETLTEVTKEMAEKYKEYPAGGFTIFSKNIVDPEQLMQYNQSLKLLNNDIIPSLSIDEEGGVVARIANSEAFKDDPDVKKFESMEAIAETKDLSKAYEVGTTIGKYLKKYGFDIDFAPVSDVNTNPENVVIGSRAFGSDPELAGQMISKVLQGFQEYGIEGCLKHFPGHGDTKNDTHEGYAETTKTWEEMKKCEMIPFECGLNSGANMVMIAHISAPNVTGNKEPVSLSYEIITEKLRGELGFDGVVITDGMEMGAIIQHYTPEEASIRVIEAGGDIILLPQDYERAFNGILEAVNSGRITESRIDESVYRILKLKGYKHQEKQGWINENGNWQYYSNGVYLTGWQKNIPGWEGQWFYFNEHGAMQTSWQNNIPGWQGQWFYFDPSTGVMQTSWKNDIPGWQGQWFYFDANTSVMTKGWQYLNWSGGANWFFFGDNGIMYKNTTTPDGYRVDNNGAWIQ